MIEITVTDPAKTPRAQLAIAIAVLQAFHDGDRAVQALADRLTSGAPTSGGAPLPPVLTIAPADSPDAGSGPDTPSNPVEAFGSAAASEAFGAAPGNEAAGLPLAPPAGMPPAPPSGAQTAGAPTPGSVDVDKDGLPWDARIHASTKGKNQDGRWKAKRGVDEALVAQVQAELRALMALPVPVSGNGQAAPTAGYATGAAGFTGTPTSAPAPASTPNAGNAAATGAPNTPTPPAPPMPPATAGTAAAAPVTTQTAPVGAPPAMSFADLAKWVGELIPAGKLTQEKLTEIVTSFGLPNFGLMYNRPDLVPGVHAALLAGTGG